jgi:hypothetical protein
MSPAFLDHFLAETLGLTKLPPYLPTLYLSLAGFTLVHLVLAPWLSAKIAPEAWGALKGKRARNNWCVATCGLSATSAEADLTLVALYAGPSMSSHRCIP